MAGSTTRGRRSPERGGPVRYIGEVVTQKLQRDNFCHSQANKLSLVGPVFLMTTYSYCWGVTWRAWLRGKDPQVTDPRLWLWPPAFTGTFLFCPLLPSSWTVTGRARLSKAVPLLTSYLLGAMKFKVSSGSYRMEKANSNTSWRTKVSVTWSNGLAWALHTEILAKVLVTWHHHQMCWFRRDPRHARKSGWRWGPVGGQS